jgi:hypothetical protein
MIDVPDCGWRATKSSDNRVPADMVSVSITVHTREGVTAKRDRKMTSPTNAKDLIVINPLILLGNPHLRHYIEGNLVGSTTRTISNE